MMCCDVLCCAACIYLLLPLQGMSINRLVVHLAGAFGAGMVYVALSRCTSNEGLQVSDIAALAGWPVLAQTDGNPEAAVN